MFHGSVHGLLMMEHIYSLSYEDVSNTSGTAPNIRQETKYRRQLVGQINTFDLIKLASCAIEFRWYDIALRLLKYASNNIDKKFYCNIIKTSTDLDRIISVIKSVAKRGLLAQKGDELFDARRWVFMSITQRFDFVTESKVEKNNISTKVLQGHFPFITPA